MSPYEWAVVVLTPLSGIVAVLITLWVAHRRNKTKETADYAGEVLTGWEKLTARYEQSSARLEKEVRHLRSEVLALRAQLIHTGCGKNECANRVPVAFKGSNN